MLVIPAVDIQDGCVVRFVQGRLNKKIYSRDPLKTARHWVSQGAKLIHLVDLDGAKYGVPKNLAIVRAIAASINAPIEFGGGVRSIDLIKKLLDQGIYRVVLGTRAVESGNFLKKAFKIFKNKIIVSVDVRLNRILVQGWKISFRGHDVLDFIRALKKIGFKEVIYTDILKDGTLSGPNIKGIKTLLHKTAMKVIASGGICSLDDIYRLKLLEKDGLSGVIVGKALYEGKFTLPQALKLS